MRKPATYFLLAFLTVPSFSSSKPPELTSLQICKAGIATYNGRSVRVTNASAAIEEMISVSYTRDDGRHFMYDCKVEGSQIRWRTRGMTRWNTNVELHYRILVEGKSIEILTFLDNDVSKREFKVADL